jgi:hypothetical protein
MTDLEDNWPAQQPRATFAEQVVAAALRERRTSVRWRRVAIGAGFAAVAAGVALFVGTRSQPSVGEARADRRIEVSIGSRAVAVLEPGAHISWQGDTVVQDAGDVFYRVERGADSQFEVRTPMADAAVLGTCFRISVNDKERIMNRRDVIASTVGAVAATVVLIGVYEGKVAVSQNKESPTTVGAGETVVADRNGVRPAATVAQQAARPIAHDDGARTAADLRERLDALEQEKAQLEQELAAAHEGAKSQYDLSPDDWAKLAERGEFKYQVPCFQEGGFHPSPEQLAKLGLSAKDGDVIHNAYVHANEQLGKALRDLCILEMGPTRDEDIPSCVTKMFTNLYAQKQARTMYTQVDEIRAGKRPEPAQMSPTMKMLMLFSTGMTGFEQELAQTYGADEAHRLAFSDGLCFQSNAFR